MDNYKYKHLALIVLAKALDDICPKFSHEPENLRQTLIDERVAMFRIHEKALDKEWRELEKESTTKVNKLKKERTSVIKKLNDNNKSKRIKTKITGLRRTANNRIKYIKEKFKNEETKLTKQLKTLTPNTKKFNQIQNKLDTCRTYVLNQIKTTNEKFEKAKATTLELDNSDIVKERIQQAHIVWKRKFGKLKEQYKEKEFVHHLKRTEFDQIRLATESFENETFFNISIPSVSKIEHWCELAGVSKKDCYLSVVERLALIGRKSEKVEEILKNL